MKLHFLCQALGNSNFPLLKKAILFKKKSRTHNAKVNILLNDMRLFYKRGNKVEKVLIEETLAGASE